MPSLSRLNLQSNKITSLDLLQVSYLTYLAADVSLLLKLDFGLLPSLTHLNIRKGHVGREQLANLRERVQILN